MKRTNILQITTTAFCVVINLVGAFLALTLRLPVYMDNIGTVLAGALLGPFWGATAACLSGIISGVTSDIYALFFIPGAMLTGVAAGYLFRTKWMRRQRMPIGTAFLTVPGALVSAATAAFVFDGVTSAGSSMIVQVLRHMGLNLVASAFVIQLLTEYVDRFITVSIVLFVVSRLGAQLWARLQSGCADKSV